MYFAEQRSKKHQPAEWNMCFGHEYNKCGWKIRWPGMWCEECYADYLSDPDAYK